MVPAPRWPSPTTGTASPSDPRSASPKTTGSPGKTTGREVISSCSLAKVTAEPENDTEKALLAKEARELEEEPEEDLDEEELEEDAEDEEPEEEEPEDELEEEDEPEEEPEERPRRRPRRAS